MADLRSLARLAAVSFGLGGLAAPLAAFAQSPDPDLIARGEYVARAADCSACHTDPSGGKPYAGGYAIASPMGEIIATNITPSTSHGIGGWSEAEFARAIREGVTPDGTHLYPAMPYPSYAKMTDDDVSALYAYLTAKVAPVDAAPTRKTALAFPFDMRALMIGWNLMFSPKPGWTAPAGLTDEQARGAYLVQGPAHCGTCHTPRGPLMNTEGSKALGGADLGGWRAPNITPDAETGIGDWSTDEIVAYLRDGIAPGRASAAGPMAEAVEHSFRHLDDADLSAIAAYLKVVPPIAAPRDAHPAAGVARTVPVTAFETTDWTGAPDSLAAHDTTDGALLYASGCAACHGADGKGAPDGHFPDLTATGAALSQDPANLVMTIVHGVSRHDAAGYTVMPAFDLDMDDAQVAAVSNFVTGQFGNPEARITAAEVGQLRRGGETPWIARNAAWLTWLVAALIVVVVLLAAGLLALRSRRAAA